MGKALNICLLALVTGVFSNVARAQETKKDDKNAVVAEEIEVVRPYKPILAEAVKLRRSPNLDDTKGFKAKMNYATVSHPLSDNTGIQKLQAQELVVAADSTYLNNLVKLGGGNNSTLFAEGYFGLARNPRYTLGAFVQHISQDGKLEGQANNRQQGALSGKLLTDFMRYTATLGVEHEGVNFYGLPAPASLSQNIAKNSLSRLDLQALAENRAEKTDSTLRYSVGAGFRIFSNNYNSTENIFNINAGVAKDFDRFTIGLKVNADLGHQEDSVVTQSNNIVSVLPYIGFKSNNTYILAGVRYVYNSLGTKTSTLFPYAQINVPLAGDNVSFFATLDGYVKQNTLGNLSRNNPWMSNQVLPLNSVYKYDLEGGFKGNVSAIFGYSVKAYFRKLTNMPLFVNTFNDPSRFNVLYDFGNATITGFEGDVSLQLGSKFNGSATFNVADNKPGTEEHAWYMPDVYGNVTLNFKATEKLLLTARAYMQSNTFAKMYTVAPSISQGYYIPETGAYSSVKLKGFADLGLSASYQLSKRFGIFVNAANLLNSANERFMFYPTYGTTVFGGLTFSF